MKTALKARPATLPYVHEAEDGPEELREIIHGIKHMSPSPFLPHQRILRTITKQLYSWEDKHPGIAEILTAPMDVVLEPGKLVLQPDIVVVLDDRKHILQKFVMGAPSLVVEIVSPGSLQRDAVQKRELYQQYGVLEYWLVIPEVQLVEVLALTDAGYVVHSSAVETGSVHSRLLPDFGLEVAEIWPQKTAEA